MVAATIISSLQAQVLEQLLLPEECPRRIQTLRYTGAIIGQEHCQHHIRNLYDSNPTDPRCSSRFMIESQWVNQNWICSPMSYLCARSAIRVGNMHWLPLDREWLWQSRNEKCEIAYRLGFFSRAQWGFIALFYTMTQIIGCWHAFTRLEDLLSHLVNYSSSYGMPGIVTALFHISKPNMD